MGQYFFDRRYTITHMGKHGTSTLLNVSLVEKIVVVVVVVVLSDEPKGADGQVPAAGPEEASQREGHHDATRSVANQTMDILQPFM